MIWSAHAAAQAPGSASFPAPTEPPPHAAPLPPPEPSSPPASVEPAPPPAPSKVAPAAAAPAPGYTEPSLPEGVGKQLKPSQRVSITFSPLHLLSPIFELQIEAMVTSHFSVAAIGGIGSIKAESTDPVIDDEKFAAYVLGLQLTGYPLRDFSSLQLGAELLWIKVSTENFDGREITADAGGVALGPFIGYKLLTNGGFTFFAQGGFQYAVVQAQASDSVGNSAQEEQSAFIPLLNLNLGWSF